VNVNMLLQTQGDSWQHCSDKLQKLCMERGGGDPKAEVWTLVVSNESVLHHSERSSKIKR
jgi:hypothetical protein